MKKISVLALILALVLSLTACFGGEKELYNAMNKMKEITTLESETELGFNFSWEGFSTEDEITLQQLENILNAAKFNIHQKSKTNEDKTTSLVEADVNISLGITSLPLKVWLDADVSEDNFKLVEVLQLPPILGMFMPNLANVKYLVYDFNEIMDLAEEDANQANMEEIIKLNKELQPKLLEFVDQIQEELKPDIKMISKKGKQEIDGEKLTVYEIKLNDETLKELVKYTVDYILENEDFEAMVREYMNSLAQMAIAQEELTEEEAEEMTEEFNTALAELMPEVKEEFHKFMEKYKDVQILGENGILIELGINKDGYLVHEKGNIDLRIDFGSIARANGEEIEKTEIINLGIEYKTKTYNINSEEIEIKLPELTEGNSVKYTDLIKLFEEQLNMFQVEPEMEVLPLP